ncbi:MAG: hypothetical protein KJN82_02440, partial [Bacteroidia bacterium]|nr:hypothetical protein [Bacteroidia bacterium]
DDSQQVHIIHDGVNMFCDLAIHYKDQDFVEAYGDVKVVQGDSVTMTSKYAEYSGKTKIAYASGNVVLKEPASTLTTDTLFFDRVKQQAFYKSKGRVVKDSSGVITSQIGRYYLDSQKYQFVKHVKLVNEEYTINSEQLDFYSETGHAYLFGPTTIVGDDSTIYCERGFYDTENDIGYFIKNSRIDYDNRIIEGDSMFFNRNRSYASASNNIKITDTINKLVIKGHYAEVFKDQDSVFITKRALAISVQEQDSIYIHGDTLMVTGDEDNRITRGFFNVKIFKTDLSGKADSIHVNHKTGLTQLINIERFNSKDAFAKKRYPILWNKENQMTGDSIHLISNTETEQLDSLKVFNNAFVVSKDTIAEGFNQIKGKQLFGLFKDNELYTIDIIKNAETIYYLRNDAGELVGIDKSKSGNMKIWISNNTVEEIRKINQIDGGTYPEEDYPKNETKLRGFIWRDNERPKSIEDLFIDDKPYTLPVIKGLDPYVPAEDFEDNNLIERVKTAEPKAEKGKKKAKNKAAKRLNIKEKLKKPIDSISVKKEKQ